MKILINALSGIGDALMFTPALKLLRENSPDSQVDILVMYKGAEEMFIRTGLADRVIFHNFLFSSKIQSLRFIFSLRNKYDVSINVYPSNRLEYNVINYLVAAKRRYGVKYTHLDTINLGILNNIRIRENNELHNVEENIRMVSHLLEKSQLRAGPLLFPVKQEDLSNAEEIIKNAGLYNRRIIGFHAGCSTLKNHINRRWPEQNFAELGRLLIRNTDYSILLFGGTEELSLNESIKKSVNSSRIVIAESKTLTESAALMRYCSVFVTNDSGLMHIAASQSVKIVPLIGPTNQNYIYPWQTRFIAANLNLECSPCFYYSPRHLKCNRTDVKYKCMKELSPELVMQKISILLQN